MASRQTCSETRSTDEHDDDIWGEFDRRSSTTVSTPTLSAIIEVRQYLEEPNIGRHEDPLVWWKGGVSVYPKLSAMAKRQLSIVATSVPSERVFEKWSAYLGEAQSANRKERPDGHVSECKYWEILMTVALRHET